MSFVYDGITYVLRAPNWLWLFLASPLFVAVLFRTLANLPWQQRVLSLILRLGFIATLILGLSRVAEEVSIERVCTVFLVDISDSITDEALQDAQSAIDEAWSIKGEDDLLRIVIFGKRPTLLEIPSDAAEPPRIQRGDGADGLSEGTNLQSAMQLAAGLYPPGYLRKAIIFSDGLETEGDILAEASRYRELGIRLHALPYRHPPPPEIAIRNLRAPDSVKVGEPFELQADIYASREGRARLRLYQGEVLNGLDGIKTVDLAPGANDISFRSVVRLAGELTYDLKLEPLSEDSFEDNNRYTVTVNVPGRPAVLYIEGEPARSGPLASALERQGFDVDVRGPSAFPASLTELERYDFFILSDVRAEQVSLDSQKLIERYLRELGGGFLFAGGPNGYSPGGWQRTTVERILPVRMEAEKQRDEPSVALSLVIDRSGSMSGLPMEMAKEAAKAAVDTLAADDLISVIAFDTAPSRAVKMQHVRNRSRIKSEIARIQAGGGTEIFPALDAAYQDLSVTQARRKHVVLLTDGRASSRGIRDLVKAMAAESITVTTVGLGDEVDDQLLSSIRDYGGGRYHKAPDANSLPRIFTREAEMVSKSATVLDYFPVQQTSPASFLRGIDLRTAPFLAGYTATSMKPSPAQQILQNPDHRDPLLARWHVGLGWSLAWTSDVKARFAADWARWQGWPQFWGQLVREHMRQRHHRELDMQVEIAGGYVRAVVDAFTPDDRFDNGLISKLTVLGPQPGGERFEVTMQQSGPGRYEAQFALDRYGSFLLRADHSRLSDDGRAVPAAISYGQVSYPYPAEYASFEPDIAKLEEAALATGGTLGPDLGASFDPEGELVHEYEDKWKGFVIFGILLMIFDLFIRRVRLFDRNFVSQAGGS